MLELEISSQGHYDDMMIICEAKEEEACQDDVRDFANVTHSQEELTGWVKSARHADLLILESHHVRPKARYRHLQA